MRNLWLHITLFLVTLVTTTAAGALQAGADFLSDPREIVAGLPFALTLMSILLVHEMGHYLTSRYYGVKATLPYFIPGPSFVGTFGAFIKMQSQMPDRRSLFDIGAAGPVAGFVLAVPAVIVGFQLSSVVPQDSPSSGLVLGSSLLLNFLSKITLGILPEEANIVLHPVGSAGWVGLFVTAMNLLPAGQLDGGHVTYALFGRRHIWVSRLTVFVILTLGVTRLWDGWLIWGILLLFLGVRHPPPLDPDTPLDPKRKFMGWFLLAILAVTFIPVPISFHEPEPREERREPEAPETLQRTRGGEVFHERATELAPVFHDDHASGGGALHL
ncbi:MAG TPA: site-2 protease family protein [Candidatus Binatia bacterium]|jgi:membrane-associated protease RseP (regulator of RpoE activity)